jgi:hypothetical protein
MEGDFNGATDNEKTGQAAGLPVSTAMARVSYFTASNSTSNISVALGGMTPPAPRAP